MNTQVLIEAVVQQTMVFIAQLATAGGIRAPLAHVADQVFLDLTRELQNQGVRKKVIADMFGMALRTYHRRVRELGESRTDVERTLWEAVLGFLRERGKASAREVQRRFRHDDAELLSGVLNDLVNSGLCYRAGRGDGAVYRLADQADFEDGAETSRSEANDHLVWLAVYRNADCDSARLAELTCLDEATCKRSLERLVESGRLREVRQGGSTVYQADQFEVPFGTTQGWEAAVLDHFQAMVGAITAKLSLGVSRAAERDVTGGSTWSLDVWEGHPFESEALGTLSRIRAQVEELRRKVDAHNETHPFGGIKKRVVFYLGQYVRTEDATNDQRGVE